jgi:hypothetical protein
MILRSVTNHSRYEEVNLLKAYLDENSDMATDKATGSFRKSSPALSGGAPGQLQSHDSSSSTTYSQDEIFGGGSPAAPDSPMSPAAGPQAGVKPFVVVVEGTSAPMRIMLACKNEQEANEWKHFIG